jgi:hypothetical protein
MSEPAAVARVLDPARLPATSSRFDVAASLSASKVTAALFFAAMLPFLKSQEIPLSADYWRFKCWH